MNKRKRLFPLRYENKLVGLITFLIGDEKDLERYVRYDPWDLIEDNDEGSICYIDHLLVDKEYRGKLNSFLIWVNLRNYIENNFSNVSQITWKRFKNDKIYNFRIGLNAFSIR
jgi:hypothetical protein